MSKSLVLNSLSGTALYAVNVVVAFIMSPLIVRALGNHDYGLWELVMSIIGYMGLLDLGIGPAMVRFVSVADSRKDKEDLQRIISTSFVFFIAVGGVAVLSFLTLGKFPSIIAGSELKDIANVSTVFMLLGFNAGMLFPLQVFIATLMGFQRHYFINNIRMVLVIVRAVLTYYLFLCYEGYGLVIMALLEPCFTAIQFVAFAGAVCLDKGIPKISFAAVSLRKAKEMVAFGVKSATMLVASRIQSQSVPIIIGNVLGLGQIVFFVIPYQLVKYARGFSLAIGFPLIPYLGAAIGKDNHNELIKTWLNTTLALQILSMAAPVVIFFCGENFLRLWIGDEYAVAGKVVIYVLVVGLVADALAVNAFYILTALGRHGNCALVWFFLSLLSIPTGVFGAHFYGLGGVAVGTTMVTVLANLVTIYMACSAMQVSILKYLRNTVIKLVFPLLFLITCFVIVTNILPATTYLALITHLILAVIIYTIAIWLIVFDADMRRIIKKKLILKIAACQS